MSKIYYVQIASCRKIYLYILDVNNRGWRSIHTHVHTYHTHTHTHTHIGAHIPGKKATVNC